MRANRGFTWVDAAEQSRRYTGWVVAQLAARRNDWALSDWDRKFLSDMADKIKRYRGLFLSDKQLLVVLRIEDKLERQPVIEKLPEEECGLEIFG